MINELPVSNAFIDSASDNVKMLMLIFFDFIMKDNRPFLLH